MPSPIFVTECKEMDVKFHNRPKASGEFAKGLCQAVFSMSSSVSDCRQRFDKALLVTVGALTNGCQWIFFACNVTDELSPRYARGVVIDTVDE